MIDKKSFLGGVHPRERAGGKSVTGGMPIEASAPPKQVAVFLSQSVGAPCRPLVKPGERVRMGQKIGEPSGFVGAPIHASVSGKVLSIQPRPNATGAMAPAIVIENDGQDTCAPPIDGWREGRHTPEEMRGLIREAGIVGLGGAAFPTHVKLSPPKDKRIDTLILNGAECEPYLTSDHRTLLENPEQVARGLAYARTILSAERAFIGIEANKPDALDAMEKAGKGEGTVVCRLPVKYPQGGEKQLIQVITGRQVPSGKLPMDAGCVVINVSTAAAIAEAIDCGKPLIESTVTVTGEIPRPRNLRARVGESVKNLIDQCGGLPEGVNKVVLGGPMMGQSAYSLDTPIVKASSGVLLIRDEAQLKRTQANCIRCAQCARVCPIRLLPMELYALSARERYEEARQRHAMDCIECGSCSFTCPAALPLVQSIRAAKREITKAARR